MMKSLSQIKKGAADKLNEIDKGSLELFIYSITCGGQRFKKFGYLKKAGLTGFFMY